MPLRAQALRAISMELERLANHAGDMGALADDVVPSHLQLLRPVAGRLPQCSLICGSRFGRGWCGRGA